MERKDHIITALHQQISDLVAKLALLYADYAAELEAKDKIITELKGKKSNGQDHERQTVVATDAQMGA
jgi:hypothetical protein